MHHAEKHDKNAVRVESMLKRAGAQSILDQCPSISEELGPNVLELDQSALVMQVGAANAEVAHLPRSARTHKKSDATFLASAMMSEFATSGRSRDMSTRRGSNASRRVFDIVFENSSGKPQLLAALQESPSRQSLE